MACGKNGKHKVGVKYVAKRKRSKDTTHKAKKRKYVAKKSY